MAHAVNMVQVASLVLNAWQREPKRSGSKGDQDQGIR